MIPVTVIAASEFSGVDCHSRTGTAIAKWRSMEPDRSDDLSWAELCDLHEAAALEEQAAEQILQRKVGSGKAPTVEEMARLENARADRERIERRMHDFSTTRRD